MRDQNIPVLTSSVFPKHTNLSDELELQINFIYHMIYFNTHRNNNLRNNVPSVGSYSVLCILSLLFSITLATPLVSIT